MDQAFYTASIQPLRLLGERTKKSPKCLQIQSSIREVGLVKPPVMAHGHGENQKYLLLGGPLFQVSLLGSEFKPLAAQTIDGDTPVWHKGMAEWQPLRTTEIG